MADNYNDDSISSLKGAERVRMRPEVMFGTKEIEGAFHTVVEILGNSLDEVRGGHGKRVEITYHLDKSITIRDEGRGVPMGWNEAEGRFNYDLIFNELYAGGKYGTDDEDYKFSIGLNGLGAASTQYTSEYMLVVSHRTNGVFTKNFAKGSPTEEELLIEENTTGKTGTEITWKVDNEVFFNTDFTTKMFTDILEAQSHLNNVFISFKNENTDEYFEFEGEGVEEYLRSQIGEDSVIEMFTTVRETSGTTQKGEKYVAKGEIVVAITEEINSKSMHFHNTGRMRRGVHFDATNAAISAFFKNIAQENNIKILPIDFADYVSVLSSTYSNIMSLANQTKDGVTDAFLYELVRDSILKVLDDALATQNPSIKTLVENVITASVARAKAKELEKQARAINKMSGKRFVPPVKYVPCSSNDNTITELFILEGDSAKGACRKARDSSFQALIPIKGKPVNAFKTTIDKLLENEEVKSLVKVIGAGVDIPNANTFDITKCRFDKIIFTTDADVDGSQIRVLLYTIFCVLMPELLRQGKVYVALSPLFEIITNKNGGTSYFAYSVEEKEEILEELKSRNEFVANINRSKGLGQNNPDMLSLTTMHPDTRKLVQLQLDPSDRDVMAINDMLFGKDAGKERKDFIFALLENKLQDETELEKFESPASAEMAEEDYDELEALVNAQLG